jgi:hypothetical protein
MSQPIDEWLPAFAGLEVDGVDIAEQLRLNLDADAGNDLLVPGVWFEAGRIRALEQQRAGATWVTVSDDPPAESDFERRLRELEERERVEEAWPS